MDVEVAVALGPEPADERRVAQHDRPHDREAQAAPDPARADARAERPRAVERERRRG